MVEWGEESQVRVLMWRLEQATLESESLWGWGTVAFESGSQWEWEVLASEWRSRWLWEQKWGVPASRLLASVRLRT